MKTTICCILLLFSLSAFAQEDVEDYKQFEVLVKKINDIQLSAGGKRMKSENADLKVTFPEPNFTFNYHNLSATWIAKSEKGVEIIEEIDLVSVNNIFALKGAFGEVGLVIVYLPTKTGYVVVNGREINRQEIEGVPFYFPFVEKAKDDEMFNALVELTHLIKVKKGILSMQQAIQQWDEWKRVDQQNTKESYLAFLNKYPKSIFTAMATNRVEEFKKQEKEMAISALVEKFKGYDSAAAQRGMEQVNVLLHGIPENMTEFLDSRSEKEKKKSLDEHKVEYYYKGVFYKEGMKHFYPGSMTYNKKWNHLFDNDTKFKDGKFLKLQPAKIAMRDDNSVAEISYNLRFYDDYKKENQFIDDFKEYFMKGFPADRTWEKKFSNAEEVSEAWYFKGYTITLVRTFFTGEPWNGCTVNLYRHQPNTRTLTDVYNFQYDGKPYEITIPELKKMVNID